MFNKNSKVRTPIWFMRQAGRYLPEYHLLRKKEDNFLDVCFNSELAAEISLQPINRFDLDFIIVFADILVIPLVLGQKVSFIENIGPVLGHKDLLKNSSVKNSAVENILRPVMNTIKIIKQKSNGKKVIGFCGGPFTVLTYMIEKGSSQSHEKTRMFVKEYPHKVEMWIGKITDISIEYLIRQVESGADVVQIFDSWAGLLGDKEYEEYVVQPSKKIREELKKRFPDLPVIFFPRNSQNKINFFLKEVRCNFISIDQNFDQQQLDYCHQNKVTIQGNLSPQVLLKGGETLVKEVKKIMEKFKNNLHIFNLSHGILPNTPIENVHKVIDLVRNYESSR